MPGIWGVSQIVATGEGKADEAVAPVNESGMEPAPAVTILPRQDKGTAAAAQSTPAAAPPAVPPAAPARPASPEGIQADGSQADGSQADGGQADGDLFARYTRSLVAERAGRPVAILQAGFTTAGTDLGVPGLRAAGAEIAVTFVDDDQPVARAAAGQDERMAECVLGDLRTVPLPQRSFDIVLCVLLLQRIQHAELVLDRLVGALRPGGLLLLRFADRDSAGGFLDRVLPGAARRVVWRRRHPGAPGPYPAVYERLSSAKGLQSYLPMRGLVIAERRAVGGRAGGLVGPAFLPPTAALAARLSRGRLTDAHEELLYVLRKPEDLFARVL
jgi:SAM-dependent methyltransferase